MTFEVAVPRQRTDCPHSSFGACVSGKAADKDKVLGLLVFNRKVGPALLYNQPPWAAARLQNSDGL